MANIVSNPGSLDINEKTSNNKYKIGKYSEYVTAETRALMAKYADPLTLNFKILINYDKDYGLFADEKNTDSALAYLKRIGDETRYEMLKNWIGIFKIFVRDFDFLMLQVEGLDIIQNWKPWQVYTEEEKISLTVRETNDMLVQSLLTNYHHIYFDDVRGVEVIPANLRRFDMSILVFSSGYYNMLLYDDSIGGFEIEKRIFPTVRKLSNEHFNEKMAESFNHQIYNIIDASINLEESGKPFAGSIMNEQNADFIKNNMTFNFRRANFSGRWNNISGEVNYAAMLAITAVHEQNTQAVDKLKQSFKEKLKAAGKDIKDSSLNTLKTKIGNLENMVLSKNSVIGDLWSKMTMDYASQMVKNTIALGINYANQNLILDPLTQLNNNLSLNFGNNIYDIINNNSNRVSNNVKLLEPQPAPEFGQRVSPDFAPPPIGTVAKGVTFGGSNIYTGTGF